MYDRQPTPGKEGRVLITPLNGSAPYYATVAMADEPLEKGTALNKANLLKDATAAMYGKGASAVPNDIFAYLGKYAQHWWWRKSLVTATRYRLATTPASDYGSYVCLLATGTIYMADEIAVDALTGAVSLVNPVVYSDGDAVAGKYLQSPDGSIVDDFPESSEDEIIPGIVHFADTISGVSGGTNYTAYKSTNAEICTAEAYQADVGTVDYLQSPDSTAYPHSGNDGTYEYLYLGRPLDNAVTVPDFEIVSYTGTGTYGADNPNSVTFSRAPQLVIMIGGRYTVGNKMWSQVGANEEDWIYMLPTSEIPTEYEFGMGLGNNANGGSVYGGVYGKKSEDGKTISWYNCDYASWQYNDSDMVYYLLALFDGLHGTSGTIWDSGDTDEGDTGDTGDSGGTDTGGGSEDSGTTEDVAVAFTIDGSPETVLAGTTWANYIASMGNASLYLNGGYVCYNMGTSTLVWLYDPSGNPAKSTDVIVSGDYYTGPATVTFTLNGGADRTVEAGTTWETYITSLGEGTKLVIDGTTVGYTSDDDVIIPLYAPDGSVADASDVIVAGDYYIK